MKIRNLDVGLESVTRVETGADVHLPRDAPVGPAFLPQFRPLDAVLRRPSIEERLPQLLEPSGLDPSLLEPAVLSAARRTARASFAEHARRATGHRRRVLDEAVLMLEDDVALDDEVRGALAALLRA